MNYNSALYACGAILLGIITIWFGDFAMQWQPVPAGTPLRMPLAYVSGVLLIGGGGALLSRKWQRPGALLFAWMYGFWTVVLHAPCGAPAAHSPAEKTHLRPIRGIQWPSGARRHWQESRRYRARARRDW